MMQVVKPGTYVVAVSGGVDSMALLHMLINTADVELIVAHYDHGIRPDSSKDREFVQEFAKQHNLPFEYEEGKLGPMASEDLAREKRYNFLHRVQDKYKAAAVITAHHEDDVLETIIINLLRGTGRKGMSSLQNTPNIKRPLLKLSKKDILDYADKNNLAWREDPTNTNEAYLRNWVRKNIIPKLNEEQRADLLKKRNLAAKNNQTIDSMLDAYIDKSHPDSLNRSDITELPHSVAVELIAHWLRTNHLREVDASMLERVTLAAKTMLPGKTVPLKGGQFIKLSDKKIRFHKQ